MVIVYLQFTHNCVSVKERELKQKVNFFNNNNAEKETEKCMKYEFYKNAK